MNIFITGASSGVARALLPVLCDDPDVTRVRGIDLRASRFDHAKYQHRLADIRNDDLSSLMTGSHAVIHLAFAVLKASLDDEAHQANNVKGTLRTFAAAQAAGIKKVINLSSASVYGMGHNLDERAPLRPSPKFSYAQQKAEIERTALHTFPNVVHLRSHLILGPNAQPFLHQLCHAPFCIKPLKPFPSIQVVHEADVAQAIRQCLTHDAQGAYNIAAPESVSLPALVLHQRRWVMPLPLGFVRFIVGIAKKLGNRDEFTWLDVMDTSLTVDCTRAMKELNWRPLHSAWAAREAT